MKKILIYGFYLLAAAVLTSGCIKDEAAAPAAASGDRLVLRMPDAQKVAVTRAATEAECKINSLILLVYRNEALVHKQAYAAAAVTGNGTAQPSVELNYKLRAGDKVYVVANYPASVGTSLQGLGTGAAESALSALLVYDNPVYDAAMAASDPQPMYGSVVWSAGSNSCTLVRSLAKVTVELGNSGIFAGKTVKYTLAGAPRKTSMEVVYDPDADQYEIPNAGAIGGTWSTAVDADGMTALTAVNYCAPYPLSTVAAGEDLDENTFDKRRTALILRLTASGTEEYYRLDFSRQLSSTSVTGDASNEYLDIRPNTHYTFRIERVNNSGYGSAAEAWANPGGNIEYTVTVSGDGWKSFTSNGQYLVKTDRDTTMVVNGVSTPADLMRFAVQMPDAGQKPGDELPGSVETRTVALVGADRKTPIPTTELQMCLEDGTPVAGNMLDFSGMTIPAEGYRLKYISDRFLPSTAVYAKVRYGNIEHFVPLLLVRFDMQIYTKSFTYEGKSGNYMSTHSYSYDAAANRYVPCPWKAEFSTDGGVTWTTERPEMLPDFQTSGPGSLPGNLAEFPNSYPFSVAAQLPVEVSAHNDNLRTARPETDYDLSTKGGREAMNTANCYVVNAPGTYTFPLVYGNAIKDGSPNTTAYTSSATGTYALKKFVTHLNTGISNPYIYNNSGCTPADACLVWQDAPGLVQRIALDIDKRNMTFEVPVETIRQGNAIVAVRDASGRIMWSWHIWVTDYVSGSDLKTVTNRQNYQYDFMPFYLGWCDSSIVRYPERSVQVRFTQECTGMSSADVLVQTDYSYARSGNNPYYQWGRKDPMLPGSGLRSPADKDCHTDPDKTDYAFDRIVGRVTIGESIQLPYRLYCGTTSPMDWCSTTYYNLWSTNNVSTTANDTKVVKTVYDPSPAGFCVPPPNAFSGFTTTGASSEIGSEFNVNGDYDVGWNFYCGLNKTGDTVFFPASGSRSNSSGTMSGITSFPGGSCWAATSLNTQSGRSMQFTSSSIYPVAGASRNMSYAVRPVREK